MRTTRRRPETEIAKKKFVESHPYTKDFSKEHIFDYSNEVVIKEFKHWLIIENKFPYDLVLETNHMLAPRRIFGYLSEATPEELAEYFIIMKQLDEEKFYNSMMENFTGDRSIHRHIHIHLMIWKYEKDIVDQRVNWDAYPTLD